MLVNIPYIEHLGWVYHLKCNCLEKIIMINQWIRIPHGQWKIAGWFWAPTSNWSWLAGINVTHPIPLCSYSENDLFSSTIIASFLLKVVFFRPAMLPIGWKFSEFQAQISEALPENNSHDWLESHPHRKCWWLGVDFDIWLQHSTSIFLDFCWCDFDFDPLRDAHKGHSMTKRWLLSGSKWKIENRVIFFTKHAATDVNVPLLALQMPKRCMFLWF